MISDAPLEGIDREELEKSVFLFSDVILVSKELLYEDEYKWLRQIGNIRMFISEIARSCSLTYLQNISVPCQMEWSLAKNQDGVFVSNFDSHNPYQDSPVRFLTGLLPEREGNDYPLGESLNW